jgi:hypothetical protein
MEFEINLLDAQTHRFAFYLLDWDMRGRTEAVDVIDAASGALLDSRAATGFTDGQYLVWNIKGRVLFRIRLTGGANAVYSAAFLDPAAGGTTTGATTATFLGTNTTTLGNWKGTFGSAGYAIANDSSSLPSYATVVHRGALWTWSSTTADTRALQKGASSTDRIAATWYGYSPFDMDLNFTDGRSHKTSIYVLDWDRASRVETIQVIDAASGAILDSRTVSAFSGGQYWSWTIGGHVIVRLSPSSGPNAVYSGLFIDE